MTPPLHAAWPGWTAQKTLVLPIAPERWAPPRASLVIDAHTFVPKRELHVTLIGRGLGLALHGEPGRRSLRVQGVRAAFGQFDWDCSRTGELLRLEKHELAGRGRGRSIGSIIERIEMPALVPFYDALAELIGHPLAIPPPHVTLYTTGRTHGIGVPDVATLQRLTVRKLAPTELAEAAAAAERKPASRSPFQHPGQHRNPDLH